MRSYSLALLLTTPVLLLGCGKSSDSGSDGGAFDVPPPGAMTVVSIEPVGAVPAPSLIENGGFEDWVTGAPAPLHFTAPVETRGFSSLERETEDVAEGKYAARQTWAKPKDHIDWFYNLFNCVVEPIDLGAGYEFSCKAHNLSSETFRVLLIQAWGQMPTPQFKILATVTVPPSEDFQPYGVQLRTLEQPGSKLYIATCSLNDDVKLPATVIWDDFALRRAEPARTEAKE